MGVVPIIRPTIFLFWGLQRCYTVITVIQGPLGVFQWPTEAWWYPLVKLATCLSSCGSGPHYQPHDLSLLDPMSRVWSNQPNSVQFSLVRFPDPPYWAYFQVSWGSWLLFTVQSSSGNSNPKWAMLFALVLLLSGKQFCHYRPALNTLGTHLVNVCLSNPIPMMIPVDNIF